MKRHTLSQRLRLDTLGENLLPCDGEAYLLKDFFSTNQANDLSQQILETTQWRQDEIKLFGRTILQPRLTAWVGDPNVTYRYSGLTMKSDPWTPAVLLVKSAVEMRLETSFNSALINYYRTGLDSMGWHRDNEPELGINPIIASVSFGDSRLFKIRHYRNKALGLNLSLEHGDLLVMAGEMQSNWEHCVPKTRKPRDFRINITFRFVDNKMPAV